MTFWANIIRLSLIVGVGLWLIVLIRLLSHRRSSKSIAVNVDAAEADALSWLSIALSLNWLPQMPPVMLISALSYALATLVSSTSRDLRTLKVQSTSSLTLLVAGSFFAAILISNITLRAFS
jgi:hypothetical protein